MGPLQLLLFGFEDFRATGDIARELEALSDAGTIRIVDARLLAKESEERLVAVRVTDLDQAERDDLKAAAAALVGFGAGAVLGGASGAAAGAMLASEAAMEVGDTGLDDDDLEAIADGMEPGDALLLLLIENVWATGLRDAIRASRPVFFRQDYVTPAGLVALGGMLGLEVVAD